MKIARYAVLKQVVLKQAIAAQSALLFFCERLSSAAESRRDALTLRLAAARSGNGRLVESDCRGQATAEYALVILGAAALAMLFVAWATDTKRIGSFFNAVMRSITKLVN